MSGEAGAAQAGADTNAGAAAAAGTADGGVTQTQTVKVVDQGGDKGTQKPAGSLATGDVKAGEVAEPTFKFPDDWAEHMAAGDEQALKLLKRFRSPSAVGKALLDARTNLARGGQIKEKPGENATDEEKAAWREAQGVPKAIDDYEKGWKAPDGFILSEADKQIMKGFAATVHGKDWTQQQFNDAMGWYVDHMAKQQAAMADNDTDFAISARKELMEKFGSRADFDRAVASLDTLYQMSPEPDEIRAIINMARLPDGRKLGDIPLVVETFAAWAGEIAPHTRITPVGDTKLGGNNDARIAEIDAIMADPNRHQEYWNNPAMQKEYQDRLAARDRLARRSAA